MRLSARPPHHDRRIPNRATRQTSGSAIAPNRRRWEWLLLANQPVGAPDHRRSSAPMPRNVIATCTVWQPEDRTPGLLALIGELPMLEGSAEIIIEQSTVTLRQSAAEAGAEPKLERLLRQLNLLLPTLFCNQPNWWERLDLTVAILDRDQVSLAACGRGQAHLLRQRWWREVTSSPAVAVNPLKCFSNLTSGQLADGDRLLLTSPGLLDYLSADELRQLAEAPPSDWAADWPQRTPTLPGDDEWALLGIACTEAAATPAPAAANGEPADVPAGADPNSPPREPAPVAAPERIAEPHIIAAPRPALERLVMRAPYRTAKSLTRLLARPAAGAVQRLASLWQSLPWHRRQPQRLPLRTPLPYYRLFRLIDRLISRGERAWQQWPLASRALLITALLALWSLTASLSWQGRWQSLGLSPGEQQALLARIGELQTEGQAALIYRDQARALTALGQAVQLIEQLPARTAEQRRLRQGRLELVNERLRELRRQIAVTPRLLAELPFAASRLMLLPGVLAATGDRQIAIISINDPAEVTVANSPAADRLQASCLFDRQSLLLLDSSSVWRWTPPAAPVKLAIAQRPAGASDGCAVANGRLYLLDRNGNSIWLFERQGRSFGSPRRWTTSERDLRQAVDLAVGRSAFTIDQSGTLRQLVGGRERTISLPLLDPPLSAPTQIAAPDNPEQLFILEPGQQRLVAVTASGEVIRQFLFPAVENPIAFTLSQDVQIVYLLDSSQRIWQASLPDTATP